MPSRTLRKLLICSLLVCCVGVPTAIARRHGMLNNAMVSAVERGDYTGVVAALKQGADPNARQVYDNRPRNPIEVVQWLLRMDPMVWHDGPVLSVACQVSNAVPIVQALLEHGANPNANDKLGYTPLLDCIQQDNVEVVRLLLTHGADVDTRNRTGETALMLLAGNQFSTVQSLHELINHGAALNIRNADGKTALKLARESKHTSAIQVLELAGAIE